MGIEWEINGRSERNQCMIQSDSEVMLLIKFSYEVKLINFQLQNFSSCVSDVIKDYTSRRISFSVAEILYESWDLEIFQLEFHN